MFFKMYKRVIPTLSANFSFLSPLTCYLLSFVLSHVLATRDLFGGIITIAQRSCACGMAKCYQLFDQQLLFTHVTKLP